MSAVTVKKFVTEKYVRELIKSRFTCDFLRMLWQAIFFIHNFTNHTLQHEQEIVFIVDNIRKDI